MLSIVWADEARSDLLDIVAYVAERNPSAAVRLARDIEPGKHEISLDGLSI